MINKHYTSSSIGAGRTSPSPLTPLPLGEGYTLGNTRQAEDFPPPAFSLRPVYNSGALLAILSFARTMNSLNGMLFC